MKRTQQWANSRGSGRTPGSPTLPAQATRRFDIESFVVALHRVGRGARGPGRACLIAEQ